VCVYVALAGLRLACG